MSGAKKNDTGKVTIFKNAYVEGLAALYPGTIGELLKIMRLLAKSKRSNKIIFSKIARLIEHIHEIHYEGDRIRKEFLATNLQSHVNAIYYLGLKKYGRNNYKTGTKYSRFFEAAGRHLFLIFVAGSPLDVESGCSHLSHVIANLLILSYYIKNKVGENDLAHYLTQI